MYSTKPFVIIGFHGCDEQVRDNIVMNKVKFKKSDNTYDWLGHGMYFWEGNLDRAYQWAKENAKKGKISKPSVLGAIIDLGKCFDLLDSKFLSVLKSVYNLYEKSFTIMGGKKMPTNELRKPGDTTLKKNLDCAVIEMFHTLNAEAPDTEEFDTTRGVFWEGKQLYKNTDLREKNHIQVCVRNPNCVKGFFIPRAEDKNWKLP